MGAGLVKDQTFTGFFFAPFPHVPDHGSVCSSFSALLTGNEHEYDHCHSLLVF